MNLHVSLWLRIAATFFIPTFRTIYCQDIGHCTCDLTASACDTNCCCDPDCSVADRAAFSQCSDQVAIVDSWACVKNDVVFINNTASETMMTDTGLFCVAKDNYAARNYFQVPDVVNTTEQFDIYLQRYGGYSFSTTTAVPNITFNSSYYRSGDPIYTVYDSGTLGYLTLPAAISSEMCADANSAAYLFDQTFQCVRSATSVEDFCNNAAANGNNYFRNFKVISSPEALSGFVPPSDGNGTEPMPPSSSLYNSTYAVDIIPGDCHLCIDEFGVNRSCGFPADQIPVPNFVAGTGMCSNATLQVTYRIQVNGTNGVNAVQICFVFAVVASFPPAQVFSAEFFQDLNAPGTPRSGNPGYVVGLPVVAGQNTSQIVDGVEVYAISLNSDPNNWLTMLTGTNTGFCDESTSTRVPVKFGENMRSGCAIKIFRENLTETCTLLQNMTWTLLRSFDPPNYVSTWGNYSVTDMGDWVEILDQSLPSSSPSQPATCSNIVVGMNIEILYANIGALANPQPKIIGVSFQYNLQDVTFQCTGPYCSPSTPSLPQRLELISSVGFVDVSLPATESFGVTPQSTARLPTDFFYPFK